jgi:hypothetical protein
METLMWLAVAGVVMVVGKKIGKYFWPEDWENNNEVNSDQEEHISISSSDLEETSLIIINAIDSYMGETNILLKGKLSLLNDWDGPDENWDNAIDYYLDDECEFEHLEKFNINNLVKIDGEWFYKRGCNMCKIHYDFSGLKDDVPEMNIYLFDVSCKLDTMADEALDILYVLKVFLPNEKFVVYKRYGTTEDSYYDDAYLSPEQPIEHTYTQIQSLPNEENFDEEAPCHRGWQVEDLAVVLKYTDFKKIIKNHKKGMLKLPNHLL